MPCFYLEVPADAASLVPLVLAEKLPILKKILKNTLHKLNSSNTVVGTHMCQGKMPMSVRERYEKMLSAPIHAPNLEGMIENFDKALSHPGETDLMELKNAASK